MNRSIQFPGSLAAHQLANPQLVDQRTPSRPLEPVRNRIASFPLEPSRQVCVVPLQVIAFATYPGPGCEAANFGLCRYPESIEAQGHRIETGLSAWHWGSFCTTAHANRLEHGGRDNFRRCHLAIVELLQRAQRLDILEAVHDEAGLWDNWQYIAQVLGLVRAA